MARIRMKKPFKRRHIADAIINEWIEAVREGRDYSESNIQNAIEPIIDNEGNTRRVAVRLDRVNAGVTTLNIAVPLPELQVGQTLEDWVRSKWRTEDDLDEFGKFTLYGCGR